MGYRIVIGDDESIIRMDLCEMLEDAGHTVVGEAADGLEALELVRREKPDIVLLDIKMPRLDGIHAARMIGHEGLAPVLLLTAYSQEDMVDKAKDSGVLGYLVKPVSPGQTSFRPLKLPWPNSAASGKRPVSWKR